MNFSGNTTAGTIFSLLNHGVLLILSYCTAAPAFSVADLGDLQNATENVRSLAQIIRERVEPFCTDTATAGENPFVRDSFTSLLRAALGRVQDNSSENNLFQNMMVQGLAWHYLEQLGVKGSFLKADSFATCAMVHYPSCPEGAWLKGVNLIRSAHIVDGFRILDSLCTNVSFDRQRFLSEYATLSALCFLPRDLRGTGTAIELKPVRHEKISAFLLEFESSPSQTGWSVNSSVSPKGAFPIFGFSAEFSLCKQISLVFPSLCGGKEKPSVMNLRPDIMNSLYALPVEDPLEPLYGANFKVSVAPFSGNIPLSQFMSGLITNRYDMVMQCHELEKFGAISLRCTTRSVFSNVSGYEYAIVAFDRMVRENTLFRSPQCTDVFTGKKMKIRYVITMESRSAVKDKSELLLQNFLDKFEAFD